MSTFVFDIETIPDIASIRLVEGYDPHCTDEEVYNQFVASNDGKEFMPHHLHKIVAISGVLRHNSLDGGCLLKVNTLGRVDSSEKELLGQFFNVIDKYGPQLISWNGGQFDLTVLQYRALIHGVVGHVYWDTYSSYEKKFNNYHGRYQQTHLDLMDFLGRYTNRAPLDALAKMCGFPGKLGIDGSEVWNYYKAGKLEDIRNYCETDVVNTHLLLQRFNLMRGLLTEDAYASEVNMMKEHLNELMVAGKSYWKEYLEAWD